MSAQLILALALVAAAHAPPPDEAEAYRLDALQTQALNRRALSEIAPRPPAPVAAAPETVRVENSRDEDIRRRLENATQRWRDRVAACHAGTKDSCDAKLPGVSETRSRASTPVGSSRLAGQPQPEHR